MKGRRAIENKDLKQITMQKLFGTDGIRGQANTFPMDGETALLVGRAIARFFNKKIQPKPKSSKIVIGQDTRISGDMIARAVAAGSACLLSAWLQPCGGT